MLNEQKAIKCVEKLKTYFHNIKEDANVEYPENLSKTSNEYLIYIFYSCLLDYGMKSKIYHSNLTTTYKKHKEIFSPQYIVKNYTFNPEKLLETLKENVHPRYPNIALKKWLKLSAFLNENINLKEKISNFSSYEELYKFITNINGYGQKTGGLLLRLISESGVCNFTDEINAIPIDRHDVEISFLTEVINKENPSTEEIKKLSLVWITAAKKHDVTPTDIDKYLWSIGNKFCTKKLCLECPLKDICKKKI